MADNGKSGYAGKIKNSGTQVVDAVYKSIKTGTDLRSGK